MESGGGFVKTPGKNLCTYKRRVFWRPLGSAIGRIKRLNQNLLKRPEDQHSSVLKWSIML